MLKDEISANNKAIKLLEIYISLKDTKDEHTENIVNQVKKNLDEINNMIQVIVDYGLSKTEIYNSNDFFKNLGLDLLNKDDE